MEILVVILIWVLNFGISIYNAYSVGSSWVETKHYGGWPRFMSWMGAIMSASGFSWCYLIILGYAGYRLELLSAADVVLAFNLGYVMLVPGILFSGFSIMVNSWAYAYRNRTIGDIGVAAWNTYAQIHNTYNAITNYSKALGSVFKALSKGSGRKGKGAALVVIFILVIIALSAGVITTALIIKRSAGTYALPQRNS